MTDTEKLLERMAALEARCAYLEGRVAMLEARGVQPLYPIINPYPIGPAIPNWNGRFEVTCAARPADLSSMIHN